MTEVIVSPDCTAIVRSYLLPKLNVPISTRVPNPRPGEFVRLTQVPSAGFTGKVLFGGSVVVEVWAATTQRCAALAGLAEAHLSAATAFYALCGGPGQYPDDPATGTPKYGFTAEIFVRGTIL